jgi:hypothetical protein
MLCVCLGIEQWGGGRMHLGEVEGYDDSPEPVAKSLGQAETY